ncbi:MAG TPA: GspH/FimT family pseudopilin [Steroidobacteraceae bacterium]|nr:GspH/FimT family pseudopilin [Steroidobacteraceae bacterium]
MKHSRGFTLFELMVTIGVVAVLLGLAVPTFREFTRNNSVTAVQNDLVTSFNLARSEALRRNRPVSICASADGTTCGEDTDWNQGWIAFIDRGTAGELNEAAGDSLLNAWISANSELTFFSDGSTYVQYRPTGMSAAEMTIDVSWPGCAGLKKRRITVTPTGAITGQVVDCAEE